MAKKTHTTPDERTPYITALVSAAPADAVQELLEAGISNIASGSKAALDLAAKLEAAITTDTPPKFELDQAVTLTRPDGSPGFTAKVQSRYLNERGIWEYQVLFTGQKGRYTEGVLESDLEAA